MSIDATPVALGPVGLARWIWRQLTSMRTALILLLLLAIRAQRLAHPSAPEQQSRP